jgi:hypothetical protein
MRDDLLWLGVLGEPTCTRMPCWMEGVLPLDRSQAAQGILEGLDQRLGGRFLKHLGGMNGLANFQGALSIANRQMIVDFG